MQMRIVRLRMTPDVPYHVIVNEQEEKKRLVVRPRCRQPLHLSAGRDGVTEVTYVPLDEPADPRRNDTKK